MRIQKKTIFIILITILSIILSSYLWKHITLPYKENGIIGIYSINNYNSNNEILRYLFFILFPVFVYLSLQIYFNKFSYKNLFLRLKINEEFSNKNFNFLKLTKYFFIFFVLSEFLSAEFTLSKLDLFHEGQRLASAYKSFLDGSLWSGSYVTVGIFYETLSAKFIWQLFNHESIGLMRIADRFYILICKILVILLVYKITIFSNLRFFYKEFFFFLSSLILITYLFDYNTERNDAEYLLFRELPVLLISYFFFEIISKKKSSNLILFFLGSISILSILWSVDRGIVSNILIFLIIFYFIITTQFKNALILSISVLSFWILVFYILGNEFNFFIDNTFSLLSEINYIHGEIHATPLSLEPESIRFSKVLISIIFCLIISLNYFLIDKNNHSIQFKLALLLLAIISFLTYGYNLGRSGGIHLREVFGYSIFFITILVLHNFFHFLSKKDSLQYKSSLPKKFLLIAILSIISFFSLNISIENILDYKVRFVKYINLNDDFYLHKVDKELVKNARQLLNNYDCIQLFTNQAAYLYLFKKKNCTKYYFVWSVGSVAIQNKLIKDLKDTDIILTSEYDDKGHPTYKLPIVSSYINQNFSKIFESNNKRIILKKD